MREIENEALAQKINSGRMFEPKIKDSLDDVTEIIDMPGVKHKKIMHPYVEPTVQTADETKLKKLLTLILWILKHLTNQGM